MTELLASISSGVTEIMKMLGSVTTSLLGNELFAYGLAVLCTSMLIGIVASLVRRGRQG